MRVVLVMILFGLSACTSLSRSERSDYSYDDDTNRESEPTLYGQRANTVEAEAREELGFGNRPLTEDEQQAVTTRVHLKRAEGRLATKREKKQYYGVRGSLKNDRERLYFLSLPTIDARERFASTRGLNGSETHSDEVAKIIEAKDIALGMSQKSVLESWGDPDGIEVAGNQLYGYERWKYNRYISGSEGYQKEMRVVYFEGGHVVGWERP